MCARGGPILGGRIGVAVFVQRHADMYWICGGAFAGVMDHGMVWPVVIQASSRASKQRGKGMMRNRLDRVSGTIGLW